VLPRPADGPDSLIGITPDVLEVLEGGVRSTSISLPMAGPASGLGTRFGNLTVDIELELWGSGVANADRNLALGAREPRHLRLGPVSLPPIPYAACS
jgi:hypothetical protein